MGKKRRLSMRKIKEVLRLKFDCDLGNRKIGRSCSISHSTVAEYLDRFEKSGLPWPLPAEVGEETLEEKLYPLPQILKGNNRNNGRPEPDWALIHEELRRKGVTLLLLWQEYHSGHPAGYRYSQFCELYRRWKKKLHVSMRQTYRAGEKMFVDYCGQTVGVKNGSSEELIEAQIFVAVLGASNYIYAEAHYKQDIAHWLGGHIRAFEYFGGVPEVVVPDNLKAGVKSPCRYEPALNPSYNDLAKHYQVAVLPARVRKPKDKAKAEVGVQFVQRWILAVLRKRTFFSLHELNLTIKSLLVEVNNREMRHLGQSRREMFEILDQPALAPLPHQPYQFWEWKKAKVPPDYHVKFGHNYYSVPSRYVQKTVDLRASQHLVEIYYKDKAIAYHRRTYDRGFTVTDARHMPKRHRAIAEVNAQHLMNWSEQVGPKTTSIIHRMLSSGQHPEQSYRKCLGVLRLGGRYGEERLEAACKRALHFGVDTYKGVEGVLKSGYDKLPLENDDNGNDNHPQSLRNVHSMHNLQTLHHENIRGGSYYQQEVEAC